MESNNSVGVEYMMGQRVGEDGVRPNPAVLYQAIQSQKAVTQQNTVSGNPWVHLTRLLVVELEELIT